MVADDRNARIQEVDNALKNYRQGDFVLGEHWFVYRFNRQIPLTVDSLQETDDLWESQVKGFVIVTQTCDIVRTCDNRPFLEIVPLVEVDAQRLDEIKRFVRPQYAYISGAAKLNLVADLDRVMTIEKAIIMEWNRVRGCNNDEEIRALGQALTRKRARFAFPDDFNQFVKKLQKRLCDKHDRNTDEGVLLRALREIRVRAEPEWSSENIYLMFWFITDEVKTQPKETTQFLNQWLTLIPTSGRFQNVDGLVTSLEDMTAKDYVESDPLDLDHLSS